MSFAVVFRDELYLVQYSLLSCIFVYSILLDRDTLAPPHSASLRVWRKWTTSIIIERCEEIKKISTLQSKSRGRNKNRTFTCSLFAHIQLAQQSSPKPYHIYMYALANIYIHSIHRYILTHLIYTDWSGRSISFILLIWKFIVIIIYNEELEKRRNVIFATCVSNVDTINDKYEMLNIILPVECIYTANEFCGLHW